MKKSAKVLLILAVILVSAGFVLLIVSFFMGVNLSQPIAIDLAPYTTVHSETVAPEATVSAADALQEEVSDSIRSLNIDWLSGSVVILVTDDDKIGLSETASVSIPENQKYVATVNGNEMVIKYKAEQTLLGSVPAKALTVYLPKSYAEQMQTIKISTASADCSVSGVTADKLVFNSSSGNLEALDMTLGYLSADTSSGDVTVSGFVSGLSCDLTSGAIEITQTDSGCKAEVESTSGDITLSGAYSQVDADSTSGTIRISSSAALRALEVESTSGDVVLTVPSGSAFELEFDTASGSFSTDIPLSQRGESYTLNSGGPEFDISTTSGSLTVLPYTEP